MMFRLWCFAAIFVCHSQACPHFEGFDSLEEYHKAYGETVSAGKRVYLTDALNNKNAACLDGSPGVFYYRKGWDDGETKFHIYLEGGGACAGIEEQVIEVFDSCVDRAGTALGSSNSYPVTANFDFDYMSTDASINPLSYNWNTLYVKYCDGSGYSSNNETLVYINDSLSLHMTGFRILYSVFDELLDNDDIYHYSEATDVLLSGCSAGGIGVYLHSDYIYNNKMPNSQKIKTRKDKVKIDGNRGKSNYKNKKSRKTIKNGKNGKNVNFGAMPDSGFLLEYEGAGQFMTGMKWIFDNGNLSASLIQECLDDKGDENKYMCVFVQEMVPYLNLNIFGLQSQYDAWQTSCELMSNSIEKINVYGKNFSKTVFDTYLSGKYSDTHYIFLDSCHHHCGEWNDIVIDGYKSNQAQYDWYNGNFSYHSGVWFQNKTYPCPECCNGKQ